MNGGYIYSGYSEHTITTSWGPACSVAMCYHTGAAHEAGDRYVCSEYGPQRSTDKVDTYSGKQWPGPDNGDKHQSAGAPGGAADNADHAGNDELCADGADRLPVWVGDLWGQ